MIAEKARCWEGRVMLERWAEMVRGHPINPQQAASYPLYKVIFLVPALSRVRAPSKFPTIDRTTRDHCYDQSALGLLRKAQYEFHVSWLNLLRRSEFPMKGNVPGGARNFNQPNTGTQEHVFQKLSSKKFFKIEFTSIILNCLKR